MRAHRLASVATAAITTLLVLACAQGTEGVDVGGEAGVPEEASTPRDVFVVPVDSSVPPADTGPMPEEDAASCTMKVVINELRVAGTNSADDEFVELYNTSSCAVPLGNWELKYESSGGGGGSAGYKFMVGESIPKKGYFLVATGAFAGAKDATLTMGFAGPGGQVGLLDDKGKVVDAVGYGNVTAGDYREKQPAPAPVAGKSIGRVPDGTDTDSNSADFTALTASSPGKAN